MLRQVLTFSYTKLASFLLRARSLSDKFHCREQASCGRGVHVATKTL